MCGALYVTAASDKQRGGRVRPTHKKSLQTLKRVWRAVEILSGRDKSAHQSTVFFIWWAVRPIHYKQRADESRVPHKFIGSASMRLALTFVFVYLNDIYFKFFYIYKSFTLAFRAIKWKIFKLCIIPNFNAGFISAYGT